MIRPVPKTLLDLLYRELDRKERVVWHAQPVAGKRATGAPGDVLGGMFFVAIPLVTILGVMGWIGERPPTPPNVWADLFVFAMSGGFLLFGLVFLLSPFWGWWVDRRTLYVITDRRAILIQAPLRRATFQSFAGKRLAALERRDRPDGLGDLIFGRSPTFRRQGGKPFYREIGFLCIPDAGAAEPLLRALAPAPTGGARPELGGADA